MPTARNPLLRVNTILKDLTTSLKKPRNSVPLEHPRGTRSRLRAVKAPRAGKRMSLRDQAYEAIKHQIVTCELKPGEPVTVTGLAEALTIGRTPVIQAIDRLTVDGLVRVMPRKGVVVSPVSLNDFVEIIEVRLLNEARAARWAAERAQRTEIAEMKSNLNALRGAAKQGNIDDFIALDRTFHRMISNAARNRLLADILSNLHDRSLRFWFISARVAEHTARVCEEHAAIFEAIRSHDPDAAEKMIQAHISSFHSNAMSQIIRT
jgi:DNA-binding GntR family transcriptional regulator